MDPISLFTNLKSFDFLTVDTEYPNKKTLCGEVAKKFKLRRSHFVIFVFYTRIVDRIDLYGSLMLANTRQNTYHYSDKMI